MTSTIKFLRQFTADVVALLASIFFSLYDIKPTSENEVFTCRLSVNIFTSKQTSLLIHFTGLVMVI